MNTGWEDEAKAELKAAAFYYEEQADGLGTRFIADIEATLARIISNPIMPRRFDGRFRRVMADRFPYFLVYEVTDETLKIMAVMHTSRRPGYWKSRLKGG